MTKKIKKISVAFGSSTIELDIPERNISSVILPSEPEKRKEAAFWLKSA